MTNLDNDDFKYFDSKFNTIHSRISDIANDLNAVKVEAESRLTKIETEHSVGKEHKSSTKKDIVNALSIIGAYITIGVLFFV